MAEFMRGLGFSGGFVTKRNGLLAWLWNQQPAEKFRNLFIETCKFSQGIPEQTRG